MPGAERPFRFGLQVRGDNRADELRAIAVAAERAGFDVLSTFDHVGTHWSALTPLTAMALATGADPHLSARAQQRPDAR